MNTNTPSAAHVADAAKVLSLVHNLQAAVGLARNLLGLVRHYTSADAGKPEREQMLAELRERLAILDRAVTREVELDPGADLRRVATLDDDAQDNTTH